MAGEKKRASGSDDKARASATDFMQNEPLFVFASRIQQSETNEQVWSIIEEICESLELTAACCRCFPNGATAEPIVFFSKTESFSRKLERALESIPGYLDAFLHASVNSSKPFRWREVIDLLDPKSPQIETYYSKIESLGEGVVVPVFGPHFRNGYFCYSGVDGREYSDHDMML